MMMPKAMHGSMLMIMLLLAFLVLDAAHASTTPNHHQLKSTTNWAIPAAAGLFSVGGGLKGLVPLQRELLLVDLLGGCSNNLTTGLDHGFPPPLDFKLEHQPHLDVVVGATTSPHRRAPLDDLLAQIFRANNFNNNKFGETFNKNKNDNIDMLVHGQAEIVEGLRGHGATRVETPSSSSPSPSWRGFSGPAVARLLLARPLLALAGLVDSSLPSMSWAFASSAPSWWASASSQLASSIVASVPSMAAATWAWVPLWSSAVPFVQAGLTCVLALLCYALATQADPVHRPLPAIRGHASSCFWSSWSSPAMLALAISSSLPCSWPSWPADMWARMRSMLARPAAAAAPARRARGGAQGLGRRRRHERRVDVGPSDVVLIARSIEACFNAAHAPGQPARNAEVPLMNNNNNTTSAAAATTTTRTTRRRRERRVDVGPSDFLLMARSIDASFNAAHAPAQPAHEPAQPAHDDEALRTTTTTTTTTTRRRRERRVDVGPSDFLLMAQSIDASFNAAHAPAQPALNDEAQLTTTTAAATTTTRTTRRRRERRVDVGPSDFLLMARSIDASFNAAHEPAQPAQEPAQPAQDDEVPLTTTTTAATKRRRRRERRVDVGPSDFLLMAQSIDASFNAAHAPAQLNDEAPLTTTTTTTRRRRRERRVDVGPSDFLLLARSIDASFNAAHAPAQPALNDEAPLTTTTTAAAAAATTTTRTRRERRVDVGPSDFLLMARSIDASFNAAHAPAQPAPNDEAPLTTTTTTTTRRRRRERRVDVGPSDFLLLARSIDASFNAAHAPAQPAHEPAREPAQPVHDAHAHDDHHHHNGDEDEDEVPLVNNTRRRRRLAALQHRHHHH